MAAARLCSDQVSSLNDVTMFMCLFTFRAQRFEQALQIASLLRSDDILMCIHSQVGWPVVLSAVH